MASTTGSSSWAQLGTAALGGILSYEAGQANNVPSTSDTFTNPDIASLYYGQNQLGQPTVGYAPAGTTSSGMSMTEIVIIGLLLAVGGFLAFKLAR